MSGRGSVNGAILVRQTHGSGQLMMPSKKAWGLQAGSHRVQGCAPLVCMLSCTPVPGRSMSLVECSAAVRSEKRGHQAKRLSRFGKSLRAINDGLCIACGFINHSVAPLGEVRCDVLAPSAKQNW